MQIAHESPLCIMNQVQQMTDYDYCLVHLLEESKEYLDFFVSSKLKGRKILMDCSLFELGHAFDFDKYYNWLQRLQTDEYIIEDVWQDTDKNIESFLKFEDKYNLKDLVGKKIGVVQGKSYEDFVKCYEFMSSKADKIAISFGYDFYWTNFNDVYKGLTNLPWILEQFLHITNIAPSNLYEIERVVNPFIKKFAKPIAQSQGRLKLISKLLEDNVINVSLPHHLLGCGIPIEFGDYEKEKFSFIESLDTSHPVMTGYYGFDYTENPESMWSKNHEKMVNVFYEEVKEEQLLKIKNNILAFKQLIV